jgi:methane monooxygenase PmoA-like
MKKLVLIVFLSLPLLAYVQQFTMNVQAGPYERRKCPVSVSLPKSVSPDMEAILIDQKTKKEVPAQLLSGINLIFIADSLSANEMRTYELSFSKEKKKMVYPVVVEMDQNGMLFRSGNKRVLYYHTTEVMPPADSPSYYKRSGFIHPLYSPNGRILTDDFPAGHAHQHAIFSAWTNTTFKKDSIDFWNQHLKKGTVKHVEVMNVKQGPVCAQITAMLEYVSFAKGVALQEQWTITVYPFTDYFLFDIASEQYNPNDDTVYINKYHYGGQAFRGSKSWNPDDKVNYKEHWNILTSEGIKDSMANHTHAKWVDASGKIQDLVAGVTVIGHPLNYRYPQTIRVHPTMPYWVFSPMVEAGFTINQRSYYNSFFRYYVHSGPPDKTVIDRMNNDYAEPPAVEIKSK